MIVDTMPYRSSLVDPDRGHKRPIQSPAATCLAVAMTDATRSAITEALENLATQESILDLNLLILGMTR
jgi:hypothetical protein